MAATWCVVSHETLHYLQEDHFVLGLRVGLQLVAPPPQLAEFVLQTPGQFLSVTLGLTLPRGDQLHQLRLTLLHHTLQLRVHLPALFQLLLSAGLGTEWDKREHLAGRERLVKRFY